MINRLKILLEQSEFSGLLKIAIQELRTPQDQLRWLLRQELKDRGLVEPEPTEFRIKPEVQNGTD